jgi:hypothetical protein
MVHHPFRALAFCLLAATAACGTSEARATGGGAEANATAVPPAHVAPPAPLSAAEIALAGSPVMDVYMSPTCGCCGDWVDHMREGGFTVHTHLDVDVGANGASMPRSPQRTSLRAQRGEEGLAMGKGSRTRRSGSPHRRRGRDHQAGRRASSGRPPGRRW